MKDVAHGSSLLPGSSPTGYTLDLSGGLHPFGTGHALALYPDWAGKGLAREILGA